ncbi:MAG: signal peptide peptidase SppA [Nanoarchaeota archaeon]|nr:signal peptide peptidase SppA [Nanoarchaeota archaeon]
MAEKNQKKVNKWVVVLGVLALLVLVSIAITAIIGFAFDVSRSGNVAVINIEGPIVVSKSSAFSKMAVSSDIISFIEQADKNPSVKAVIFNINSPGGSAVATDEISQAIKKLNKTTIAVIREVGASGGYWIASSADHVIANRMSITGSIGVIGSYLEFSSFLDNYNITYQRLVSGKYKDTGSPLKELTYEEKALIQDILDEIHEEFIIEVSMNRNLPEDKVREIATGAIYTGKKAMELGLVDELGGLDEAKQFINNTLNITPELVVYEKELTLSEVFFQAVSEQSFSIGEGIGSTLFDSPGIRI